MRLFNSIITGFSNLPRKVCPVFFTILIFSLFVINCTGNTPVFFQNVSQPSGAQPSNGSSAVGGPVGYDALSSSTNFSSDLFDPSQKADALAGAAFVAPPNISNYGAVSFSYPIEIPAGRAGMQPQISLSYSSSGGDGWLGMGWSLGMGSIARTTNYGEPYYDYRDTFTWNGKRLIKVSGVGKQ